VTDRAVPTEPSIPRRRILAWALWDGGSAAYNAVILTFVFSVYLTSSVGKDLPGPIDANAWLGYSTGAAGLLIALMAPVIGARADAAGRRKRATALWTALTVLSIVGLFAVRNDGGVPYFVIGLVLLGLGSIFFELGSVSYNAMLRQVSTPATIGRVSGFGWSFGYFGGIVLLLLVYVGLIAGDGGLLGVSTEGGLNIRLVALVAAAWFALLAVPLFLAVPEIPPTGDAAARLGVVGSYRKLVADIRDLWGADRRAVWFLLSSALYRDGLAGIFTFGAVLAVTVYGIDASDVLIFGIAANVTSAVGALAGGVLEDRIGPKAVIVGALAGLLVAGTVLLFVSGPAAFWVLGLFLTLFVGPAQSSSRTFLARLAPAGHEGEMFGLYATTGRAVSFLAPTLFGLFITVTGAQRAGIVGILVVLGAGLLALLPVAAPARGNAVSTPV
jgi:MFS transporter, UMF1 family